MSIFNPNPYVSIRDDASLKSLSHNERLFTQQCALSSASNKKRSLRADGRSADQIRPVRLHLGRWDHGSECTAQWGSTRVMALCTAELVRPSLDRPAEGKLDIKVDLSPAASPAFRRAPPVTTGINSGAGQIPNFADQNQRLLSNRIMRCLERIILVGGALDTEALCLVPSQWVWRFQLALTVLDDGGNIMDAAVLAAMAALRHYRKPQVVLDGKEEGGTAIGSRDETSSVPVLIPSHLREPTPLPLHHTPLSVSFAFLPFEEGTSSSRMMTSSGMVAVLVDPTNREELLQNGSLTVGMNVHLEVCLLDYGGGCEIPPAQLKQCWKNAETSVRQLCSMLESSLEEADEQVQRDRLQKLQQQQQWRNVSSKDFSQSKDQMSSYVSSANVPFLQETDAMELGVEDSNGLENARRIQSEAEEIYRQQALNYSQGYKATKVREDDDHMRFSSQPYFNQASALLKAMLKSAQPSTSSTNFSEPNDDVRNDQLLPEKGEEAETRHVSGQSHDGSDEEEPPLMLQNEFGSPSTNPSESAKKGGQKQKTALEDEDDGEDIDDLAMAISKKKKKKGNK